MELAGPKSSSIRPTSVMLKRRLFDSIQNFEGMIFIDLCAGTGSIGLEALSRGAEKVICIDNSSLAIKLLKQNQAALTRYHLDPKKLQIVKADASKWLSQNLVVDHTLETILFYDPPYEDIKGYEQVYKQVTESNCRVKLIFEGCTQKTMPLKEFESKFPGAVKTFKQGTSFFIIYDFE